MGFAAFRAGWFGRAVRIAAGLAPIGTGLFRVDGTRGIAIAVVGLVLLLAGTCTTSASSRPSCASRSRARRCARRRAPRPLRAIVADPVSDEIR